MKIYSSVLILNLSLLISISEPSRANITCLDLNPNDLVLMPSGGGMLSVRLKQEKNVSSYGKYSLKWTQGATHVPIGTAIKSVESPRNTNLRCTYELAGETGTDLIQTSQFTIFPYRLSPAVGPHTLDPKKITVFLEKAYQHSDATFEEGGIVWAINPRFPLKVPPSVPVKSVIIKNPAKTLMGMGEFIGDYKVTYEDGSQFNMVLNSQKFNSFSELEKALQ